MNLANEIHFPLKTFCYLIVWQTIFNVYEWYFINNCAIFSCKNPIIIVISKSTKKNHVTKLLYMYIVIYETKPPLSYDLFIYPQYIYICNNPHSWFQYDYDHWMPAFPSRFRWVFVSVFFSGLLFLNKYLFISLVVIFLLFTYILSLL